MDAFAILQKLGSGETLEELTAALEKTADEVVETGNPGKVTLTIALSNQGAGDVMVTAKPSITRATPKREGRGALFFAVNGGLHREDPRQTKMEFRTVDQATGEIKDVPSERIERSVS